MTPFRTETLANGNKILFFDHSNRYYGDYHRVKVVARLDIPLTESLFAAHASPARAFRRARRWLGDSVRFEKVLERMGVAGDAVETVRRELVENFLRANRSYLEHPGFAERLLLKKFADRQKGPIAALAVHD